MTSCLIIAGEMSGEDHALTFIDELYKLKPELKFFGVGGDRLQDKRVDLIYHLNEFSSFGYSEVFTRIPFYIKAMNNILDEVKKRNCKTAILIDFQTFNLKLAGKLKKLGVKVLYYVAPQAWAWKAYRAKTLSQCVHTLFCILPFEKQWYLDRGVKQVVSISHPLALEHREALESEGKKFPLNKKKILILPGSRNFEVKLLFPEIIDAVIDLSKEMKVEVGILKSPSVQSKYFTEPIRKLLNNIDDESFVEFSDLKESLSWADLSVAASGTVTLACGLYKLPTIVCYKTSGLNYFIFENLVSYKGPGSLSNIIEGDNLTRRTELMFPELMQDEFSVFNITKQARRILTDKKVYETIVQRASSIKNKILGDEVNVVQYMADVIGE